MSQESPIADYPPTDAPSFEPKRRKSRRLRRFLVAAVIVFAILLCLLVAFIFLYLFPYRPIIKLVSTDVKNVSLSENISLVNLLQQNGPNWLQNALEAQLILRVKFKNRYHFALTFLNTQLTLLVGRKKHKIGQGSMQTLEIAGRSEVEFHFPIDIYLRLASSAGREIVQQCVRRRFVTLEAPVETTLRLGKLEITVKFNESHRIDCKELLGNVF